MRNRPVKLIEPVPPDAARPALELVAGLAVGGLEGVQAPDLAAQHGRALHVGVAGGGGSANAA